MSCREALSNVVVVQPLVRIWSGEVALKRNEDLSTAQGLPPATLVSDGSKKIIDPKALTKLSSRRRCIQRDLSTIGVRTPIGFIIQPDKEDEALELLKKAKVEFDTEAGELVMNYDALCLQQEAKNPGFEGILRRGRPSAKDVANKCSFEYAYFKVSPADSAHGEETFVAIAKATTSALAEDVAMTAKQILADRFDNKERVIQRTVDVIRQLVEKLKGFSMFDRRIAPSAKALDDVLKGLPTSGALEGTHFLVLRAMLRQMADPEELLNAGTIRNADNDEQVEDDADETDEAKADQAGGDTNHEAVEERPAPSSATHTVAHSGAVEEDLEFTPVGFF